MYVVEMTDKIPGTVVLLALYVIIYQQTRIDGCEWEIKKSECQQLKKLAHTNLVDLEPLIKYHRNDRLDYRDDHNVAWRIMHLVL